MAKANKKGSIDNLIGYWNSFLGKVDFATTVMAAGLLVTTPFLLPIIPLTYCFTAVIVLSVNYFVNSLLIHQDNDNEKTVSGKVTTLSSDPIVNSNLKHKPKPALIIQRKDACDDNLIQLVDAGKTPTRRGLFGLKG